MAERLTAVFSMKGGVGVSSTAAMLAVAHANRAEPTLLVDLGGDQPAVLGIPEPEGPGLVDWCATPSRSIEALARIQVDATPDCMLLPRGSGALPADAAPLIEALAQLDQQVIIDCGNLAATSTFATDIVELCVDRLLVVRSCYLTLRASREPPLSPTGVILLRERGRALGLTDIESVIAAPVVAEVAVDLAVARAIDAGLVAARLPRTLVRMLAKVPSGGTAVASTTRSVVRGRRP